jgi:hypothetical protein
MPRSSKWLAAALACATAACSQFDVRVDRDPSFDVARKASWAWLPSELMAPADQTLPDRSIERKLVGTVENLLHAKGYRRSDDAPELFVNYRLTTDARTDLDIVPGYGLGWWANRHAEYDTYDRGTLILDVVDARTRTLVWRSRASSRLLTHASYEKRIRRTQDVVRELLEELPEHRPS